MTRAVSTAVIVFELSGENHLRLPLGVALMISYFIANRFTKGIYDALMDTNGTPHLEEVLCYALVQHHHFTMTNGMPGKKRSLTLIFACVQAACAWGGQEQPSTCLGVFVWVFVWFSCLFFRCMRVGHVFGAIDFLVLKCLSRNESAFGCLPTPQRVPRSTDL